MALHFTEAELAGRRQRAVIDMTARGLSAMLIFRQESMFYLTGYDTFGYVFFQCLVLTDDGEMTLILCRRRIASLRLARHGSALTA